ncbi:MAG: hydrogenase nickel incorporation protein HypB [Candidatus Lokiarchaeota archaeon]|nr:hydrogenase nickel incorporation protein HypB [Candidatus Lokiarchaeota archaeon]MBD3337838.1 hydrogenase nickel incorporation protein HypB [Candidatus Lokiarchaeota archaeon]
MSKNNEKKVQRLKELESTNLSTPEIRMDVIQTKKQVEKDNITLSENINLDFKRHNIKSIDIVGAIGAGKTAIIERIAEKISSKYRTLVICGDITTRIDADRIEAHKAETVQINTGRECALNAYHIHQIIKNKNLEDYDIVIVENVGNLICPSEFILGTDKRITVVSVTEGEWVVEKHPMLFKMSEIAVINKIDLAERLGTNIEKMIRDAEKINPEIKVITTSAKTGENIDYLIKMLELES